MTTYTTLTWLFQSPVQQPPDQVSILTAYTKFAPAIFLIHLVLFLIYAGYLIAEFLRMTRERQTFERLEETGFRSTSAVPATEIERLSGLVFTLAGKGEILRPEMIRARLNQSLARHDVIIRFCLNAFVISGLLGTLYNLWNLGPSFWKGLAEGKGSGGQPAIGMAFAASIFGLAYALSLSMLETFVIRHPREKLIRRVSSELSDVAAKELPPTQSAAVAEALKSFSGASEGFLARFKAQHDVLTRQFIGQIGYSSDQLTKTVNDVSQQWVALVTGATSSVNGVGTKLETASNALTEAAKRTEQALKEALPGIIEAANLNDTLIEIRSQAASLQQQIAGQFAAFTQQWQGDLNALTSSHVDRMEKSNAASWKRHEEESSRWHERNVKAFTDFAAKIEASMSKWSEERQRVKEQVDGFVNSWREELKRLGGDIDRSATGFQGALGGLQERVETLKDVSEKLSTSYDTAFQQLNDLRLSVSTFSAKVLDNTPLGHAVNDMTEMIKDLKTSIENDGKSRAPTDTSKINRLLEEISEQVRVLPGNLARVIKEKRDGGSPPPPSYGTKVPSDDAAIPERPLYIAPDKPSIWKRFTGIFRKKRSD